MTPNVLIVLLSFVVAIFGARKGVDFVAGVQRRRKAAVEVSRVLADVGCVELPAFFGDYASGGYVQMFKRMERWASKANEGPEAVLKEFNRVGERLLDKKLATPEGRAWIAAKLAAATPAVEATVATAAAAVA